MGILNRIGKAIDALLQQENENYEKGVDFERYREKLEDYTSFAQKNIIPTFIVIGLGGNPRNPEQMFCIPLEKAKYPKLYPSVFRKFERDPRKSFFWKNGVLH